MCCVCDVFFFCNFQPDAIEESIGALQEHLVDDESIGAVVIDLDLNINFIKMHKALVYLSRPDVLFICGGSDKKIPISSKFCVIGPSFCSLFGVGYVNKPFL